MTEVYNKTPIGQIAVESFKGALKAVDWVPVIATMITLLLATIIVALFLRAINREEEGE